MIKRPTSITVIAWFFIVTSFISPVTTVIDMKNPAVQSIMHQSALPVALQYAMIFGASLVNLVCGFFLLKGKNWSRQLYLAYGVISLIISFVTSPLGGTIFIPSIVFMAVIAFFLYRQNANAYFSNNSVENSNHGTQNI